MPKTSAVKQPILNDLLFTQDWPFVDYQYPTKKSSDGLLVIVGEAPGANEVKQGRPFVGRSGQLLEKNLQAVGIERASILVANVFRYQPPKNKVDHFFSSLRQSKESGEAVDESLGRFASKYVLKKYADEIQYLGKMLRQEKPKAIITLGRTPLWALTGLEGILSIRGNIQDCRLAPGIPVIPTYHPSYIIRGNWDCESILAGDLKTAFELTQKP
ncbi:MAG: uracil-DNA glycosylase [Alphaproteobacteria bacterium]|nr:uracil-DNA glycosylase [Alphaproteobacteria bacterium]